MILNYLYNAALLILLVSLNLMLGFGWIAKDKSIFILISLMSFFIADNLIKSFIIDNKINKISDDIKIVRTQTSQIRINLLSDHELIDFWRECQDFINVFNAPWSLAEEKLIGTLKYLIQEKGVNQRIIYFSGVEAEDRAIASLRKKRMQRCLEHLKKEGIAIEKHIRIRKIINVPLPNSTFFVSKRKKQTVSLLYVYPFLREDIPEVAVEVIDESILDRVRSEFDIWWGRAEDISCKDFLNER